MEKLLTPIARAFPLARTFSISAHVSLAVTESVTSMSPASFLGLSSFSVSYYIQATKTRVVWKSASYHHKPRQKANEQGTIDNFSMRVSDLARVINLRDQYNQSPGSSDFPRSIPERGPCGSIYTAHQYVTNLRSQ